MKKKIYLLVSLVVLLGLFLSACGGETATPTEAPVPVEPTEAPTEVPEPEPTEAPEEPEMVEPEALDPAFLDENYSTMLADMQGYNTIQADELMEMMVAEEEFFLLDVRTTAEVEENGHITGAAHMPLENLTQALNMLPGPDDPIIVYCGSGWRATIAMASLHGMGWHNVRALKTSFADWVEAGNPVTEGLPGPFPANMMAYPQPLLDTFNASLAIYGVKPFGGIDAESLNTALVESPDMIVIDVRTPEELDEKGTIDTGDVELLTIPLQDFITQKDMWPADLSAQITVYCGSGHRSTMALAILGSYGYTNVTSLKGGFGGWVESGYPVVGGSMAGNGESVADMPINANFQTMLDSMEAYDTIRADGLMEELVSDNPPFLLDVRTTAEVEEQGHITGAAHMPLENLTAALNMIPDYDTPIVTYCGSGWRATIAMTSLHGMGYTNVRALKTTFAEWVEAGNPVTDGLPDPFPANAMEYPAEITGPFDASLAIYGVKPFGVIDAETFNTALVENPDMIVIDVRTESEVQDQGYIDAANWSNIALQDFIAQSEMWPADKEVDIVIYCGSGHRSTMALAILGANGYSNVSSLKGGFGGWVAAGYPVAGAKAAFAANFQRMLETMEGYNTIQADGLIEQIVADEPPFILDVRTTAEVEEQGHIEGAVNIPLDQLAQNLNALPEDPTTPIVTYCGSGWRATIAMTALHGMGWENVKALKTAFSDWVEAGNPVSEGLPEPSMIENTTEFDSDMVAALDAMLQIYGVKPFGVTDAETLNTALVENPELVVMDVRTTDELVENGVVDTGAVELITIPLQDLIAQMSQWPAADAEITVYCGSGHRSTMALAILGIFNYDTVSSLKGGFGGWAEAGFPVAEFAAP